ncbi:hypothetical protein, partial [Negativicoccus succinicivorans]|uniref:hypothetical protein n=1 Tax=Negativicoccus succinicivorans TaxID=620903 RepID=UPI0005647FF6
SAKTHGGEIKTGTERNIFSKRKRGTVLTRWPFSHGKYIFFEHDGVKIKSFYPERSLFPIILRKHFNRIQRLVFSRRQAMSFHARYVKNMKNIKFAIVMVQI